MINSFRILHYEFCIMNYELCINYALLNPQIIHYHRMWGNFV